MKLLFGCAGVLLTVGIVMILMPYHMEMTGLVLVLLGVAVGLGAFRRKRDKLRRLSTAVTVLASVGVICLMAAMSIIACGGESDWLRAEQAEYAIVLGSGVNEDGTPSRIMRSRVAAAMELLERNPDVMVVLAGGQGRSEPVTEAGCMYDYMLSLGADGSRLVLEEESTTTRENFLFSGAIIEELGGTEYPVAVVTSEFHQRRAAYIAERTGLDTCPVSAHTDRWFYRVNYTLREVFAFVKAALQSGAD